MNISLMRLADRWAARTMVRVLGRLRPRKGEAIATPVRGILAIQLWGIGETILTLPTLRAIKERFPEATLSVLATHRNEMVFRRQPFIDRVLLLRLSPGGLANFAWHHRRSFDLVVDMEEYLHFPTLLSWWAGRSAVGFSHKNGGWLYNRAIAYNDAKHTSDTFYDLARLVGVEKAIGPLDPLVTSSQAKQRIDAWLVNQDWPRDAILIGVAPGAAESAKTRLWPWNSYAQVIQELAQRSEVRIILIGAAWDRPLTQRIYTHIPEAQQSRVVDTAGIFTLEESCELISRMNLLIGNDSGPMHVGSCLNVPVVALFGPNTPVRWRPLSDQSVSIYLDVECSPCIHSHLGVFPPCKWQGTEQEQKCMRRIAPKQVLQAVGQILDTSRH